MLQFPRDVAVNATFAGWPGIAKWEELRRAVDALYWIKALNVAALEHLRANFFADMEKAVFFEGRKL